MGYRKARAVNQCTDGLLFLDCKRKIFAGIIRCEEQADLLIYVQGPVFDLLPLINEERLGLIWIKLRRIVSVLRNYVEVGVVRYCSEKQLPVELVTYC